jgi:hypothetical protein
MSIFNVLNPERVCRTRMISRDFYECKVKRPSPRFCGFSFSLGNGFVCNHLDRIIFSGKK